MWGHYASKHNQTMADMIIIEVGDDGRGLDLEAIKQTALQQNLYTKEELGRMSTQQIESLIFAPGFSTRSSVSNTSGRGIGLDVVRAKVESLNGIIHLRSTPGDGCTIQIHLPVTLATARILIVSVNKHRYGIPIGYVSTIHLVTVDEIHSVEGRETITIDGKPVFLTRLSDLIDVHGSSQPVYQKSSEMAITEQEPVPCVVLTIGDEKLACLVDKILDEQEVVLKPHSTILKRVRNVSGSAILGTGEVCIILNPNDLIESIQYV